MRVKYDKDYLLETICPHNVNADKECIYVGSYACSVCEHCVRITDSYVECNKTN